MKLKYLFTFLFIASGLTCFSNQNKIDSLETALKASKEDTNKVKVLLSLSKEFTKESDYVKAKNFVASALMLSQKLNFTEGTAAALLREGNIFEMQSNYKEALKNDSAALLLWKKTGNKRGIADSYSALGAVFRELNNYDAALQNHFNSLNIRKETGDKKGMAESYNSLGIVYKDIGNYAEAIKYNLISLKLSEEIGNKEGVANSYNDIGNVNVRQGNFEEALKNYLACLAVFQSTGNKRSAASLEGNIGNIYHQLGNDSEAIKNELACLELSNQIGAKSLAANAYNNIGAIYLDENKFDDALTNFTASLHIKEETGDQSGISTTYLNIGVIYLLQNKYAQSIEYLNKSLALAKEINQKELISEGYNTLSEAYDSLRNYKEAYRFHKLYSDSKDSLLNESNNKIITELNTKYETGKKDNEIKLLGKDKELQQKEITKQKMVRNSFIGGFAVVLLFAGVFFTQRNRISKEKKRSEALLLNILPSEVADELKAKGESEARLFDNVTVLFTDFKSFTSVAERLTPKELVMELHTCFKAFDEIIGRYRIEKIKTVGDAYLAVSGLPVSDPHHAENMINAAMEINSFIKDRKRTIRNPQTETFEIRIGINSGQVVAGIVGVKKFAYDIWGDTVNIAARMEQNSVVGKINISGSTYELVKDKFNCIHRGKIQAKNKGEIDMYFVEQA